MVDAVENVDTNGSNVDIPDADEDKLTITSDDLGTALEAGGRAMLITDVVFCMLAVTKTGKEFCSA